MRATGAGRKSADGAHVPSRERWRRRAERARHGGRLATAAGTSRRRPVRRGSPHLERPHAKGRGALGVVPPARVYFGPRSRPGRRARADVEVPSWRGRGWRRRPATRDAAERPDAGRRRPRRPPRPGRRPPELECRATGPSPADQAGGASPSPWTAGSAREPGLSDRVSAGEASGLASTTCVVPSSPADGDRPVPPPLGTVSVRPPLARATPTHRGAAAGRAVFGHPEA